MGLPTVLAGQAETPYMERLYVATDKGSYMAGESLWLSLFCLNAQGGGLASLSSVAYVELCDAQKSLIQTKAALFQGRGSAMISLPPTLPTGNYWLRAYTRYMLNEEEAVFFYKVISVYNVLSTEKIAQTLVVERESTELKSVAPASEAPLLRLQLSATEVAQRSPITLTLENPDAEWVQASLSVYALDALDAFGNPGIVAYSRKLPESAVFSNKYIADYDGEILFGRLMRAGDSRSYTPSSMHRAYFSVVGDAAQLVEGRIDSLGIVTFFTPGIYGVKNVAVEFYSPLQEPVQVVLVNPFAAYRPKLPPTLQLYPGTEDVLAERNMSMQLGHRFFLDTLHSPRPLPVSTLLSGRNMRYVLDNYTRFPLMREVITEFVAEVRIRSFNGQRVFMVAQFDGFGKESYVDAKALVLLDGVPVLDHERMINFNPLLIESLTVYPSLFYTGASTHYGVIDFKTYKGDLGGLSFPESVRISSFEGLQYPLRFKGPEYDISHRALDPRLQNLPDWRHSLYWDADLRLQAGEKREIVCHTSDYTGDFVVVLEGLTTSGKAFHQTARFSVK